MMKDENVLREDEYEVMKMRKPTKQGQRVHLNCIGGK